MTQSIFVQKIYIYSAVMYYRLDFIYNKISGEGFYVDILRDIYITRTSV